MASNIEQQNINHGQSKITRDYSSNSKGHFVASETTYKNGSVESQSDLCSNSLTNTDKNTAVKGNNVNNIKGSNSSVVNGLSEKVTASNYHITGNAELNKMGYQKMADEEQQKMVAARSQPDEVPDTSAAAALDDLFKLAPGISKCIKQPAAEKIKENMTNVKPPAAGAVIGGIMYDVQCELIKLGALISSCSTETLGEIAKIQKNYMKEKAEANYKAKTKMFEKLKGASASAFSENMGKTICPDGEFTFSSATKAASILSNPTNLMAMFIPPSTENLPKKKNFDEKEYQKIAAESIQKDGGVVDIERKI